MDFNNQKAKSTLTNYHKDWPLDISISYGLSQVLQICYEYITPPPMDSINQTNQNPP